MTRTITPLFPGFAARIEGIDAARATDDDIGAVKAAMVEHAVIVLPAQNLTAPQQVAFAAQFGPIDTNELAQKFHKPDIAQELVEPSNNDPKQAANARLRIMELSNTIWHTDSSYKTVPAHLSMLYALEAASKGGETQFADMRAGYDGLPEDLKADIEDMVAEHCVMQRRLMLGYVHTPEEREAFKPVAAYNIVRTLPESGRKTLYLSGHASHILGLPYAEGRVLLNELTERATVKDYVYTHKWTRNDLVIWDNRCTMHRICRYDVTKERRHLRRVATRDDAFPNRQPSLLEGKSAA
jgi:alpha-ketoglutarate-dependent 2,4-dichlorophenoxyacetate dioxygenase